MQSNSARATQPAIKNDKPKLTVIDGGLQEKLHRQDSSHWARGYLINIAFVVGKEDGPALRSAIDEISNEIGGRLEGPHSFATEQALTCAARALGRLRAAVFAVFPKADPDYKARPSRGSR